MNESIQGKISDPAYAKKMMERTQKIGVSPTKLAQLVEQIKAEARKSGKSLDTMTKGEIGILIGMLETQDDPKTNN